MKKRKHQKNTSSFRISYIFLILIFVSGLTFLALSMFLPQKKTSDNDSLNTVTNDTEQQFTEPGRGGSDEDDNEAEQAAQEKTPKQNESGSDTPTGSINASITKNEVVSGKYMLRVTIYELLNSGSCELYMENTNGSSIKRSANIVATGADSSSCEGFDISTSGIDGGTYNFTIKLTSGEKASSITGIIKI
jgi:hypothetical protein